MDMAGKQRFKLAFIFLGLLLNSHISLGADSISSNQSLSGDQTIVSAYDKFVLGFFKPGKSSNYYIGMWYSYKQVSVQTIVWVANREKPVSDRFNSSLRISDRNLVLFNESKIPIWSTNLTSSNSSSVEAVLQDDGNLVLKEGSNSSKSLWKSFDYPVHTWLPGNKIGYNKKTKRNTLLTSWKNTEDPSPGLYSLELDLSGSNSFIIKWNMSEQYWTSGSWDQQAQIFRRIQQSTWMLLTNQWNLFWSQPRQQYEVYAFCGAFGSCNEKSLPYCHCLHGFHIKSKSNWDFLNYSGGCSRNTKLQCENNTTLANNNERDRFFQMTNMVLPEHEQSVKVASIVECESTCLNNCSCTAYCHDLNFSSIDRVVLSTVRCTKLAFQPKCNSKENRKRVCKECFVLL